MNCIVIDDDEMSRATLIQLLSQVSHLNVVRDFNSPIEAMEFLKEEKVDLIFLDIEMPEMTGLEVLRNLEVQANIIFITSHTQYATDAFEYNALDYLIKPLTLPRLMKAVGRAKSLADNLITGTDKNEHDYFFIKKESVLDKVLAKDILWIEALGDYITVNTLGKKYILHLTMKAVESKLPADKFVRVHRSYIVHVDNIRSVEDTSIFITDVPIPVGALYKENFMNKLNLLA